MPMGYKGKSEGQTQFSPLRALMAKKVPVLTITEDGENGLISR
jgi:hypothetical protein